MLSEMVAWKQALRVTYTGLIKQCPVKIATLKIHLPPKGV
jgi:hypothetical protein